MRIDGDNLAVDNLISDAKKFSDHQINDIKQIVLTEHALVHHLINPAATMAGINVNIIKPGQSLKECPQHREGSQTTGR